MKKITFLFSLFLMSFIGATTANAEIGDAIAKTGWSVSASSWITEDATSGPVGTVIDNNIATYWHSNWGSGYSETNGGGRGGGTTTALNDVPEYLIIDLGAVNNIGGIGYVPRNKNGALEGNGALADYKVYISETAFTVPVLATNDNKKKVLDLTNPAIEGTLTYTNANEQYLKTTTSVSGRYIMLVWLSGTGPAGSGNYHATCAELNVYTWSETAPVPVEFTYNLQWNGVTKATETHTVNTGSPYPAPPAYFNAIAATPEGTVVEGVTEINIAYTADPNATFKCSDSYENITWHYLTLHNSAKNTLRDNGTESYIALNNSTTDPGINDTELWGFVGNPFDGYKIYNKNTGSAKILSSADPSSADGTTYPILVDATAIPDGYNESWDATNAAWTDAYGSHDPDKGFFLGRHGNPSHRMNKRDSKLAYWTGSADGGSTFFATEVSPEYLIGLNLTPMFSIPTQFANVVGAPMLTSQMKSDYETLVTTPTIDGYKALYAEVKDIAKVTLDPTKFYRIQNYCRKSDTGNTVVAFNGGFLSPVDAVTHAPLTVNFSALTPNKKSAYAIWKFETTGTEGTYKLLNLNSGKYFGTGVTSTELAEAMDITISHHPNAQSVIRAGGTQLHASGAYDNNKASIMLYNADAGLDNASSWYILPVETIDFEITAAGYATVNYPFAVELPEAITAYQVSEEKGSYLVLSEVAGKVIPANTPVILSGTAATYSLPVLAENTDAAISTGLTGTKFAEAIAADVNAYILGKKNDVVGFYKLAANTEDDTTLRNISANKAYYVNSAAAAPAFIFQFQGEATGIESVVTPDNGIEELYDLNGRRVAYPVKGIYVTKSGKKVFIK